jgi:cytochrome c oxidase cbb3-type subunit 3
VTDKHDELLDHDADGIREFDNALPRWWLYGFYFTIAFAAVYFVNYHVLTTPVFGTQGLAAEYRQEVEQAARSGGNRPPSANAALVPLTDPATLEKGKAIFEGPDNTCFACHRPDLGGLVGPNLTDGLWLHGCTPADLVEDIKRGFPQKGMLPYGTGKVLTDEQMQQLVSYVLSKKGSNPPSPKVIDAERDKPCGT